MSLIDTTTKLEVGNDVSAIHLDWPVEELSTRHTRSLLGHTDPAMMAQILCELVEQLVAKEEANENLMNATMVKEMISEINKKLTGARATYTQHKEFINGLLREQQEYEKKQMLEEEYHKRQRLAQMENDLKYAAPGGLYGNGTKPWDR